MSGAADGCVTLPTLGEFLSPRTDSSAGPSPLSVNGVKEIAPAYGQALRASLPSLIAQLDAELAARELDRGPEPELVGPRPGGPLASLQPLVIVG